MSDQASAEQALLNHQFPLLDTMRAVGALAVLTTHAAFWAGAYTGNGVWGTLLARLDVGVAIFFVLSGFLLSRPYLARAAVGRPRPGTGRYYWKRFLRITPLYVVASVLALALIRANADLGARDWAITLLMADTFVNNQLPHGLTQMWSLAVEVTFYILLPLLMLVATGRGPGLRPVRVVTLVGAMVAITIWWELFGAAEAGEWASGQPTQWLPAYLGWFGAGIFLALTEVLVRRGTWPRLTRSVVHLSRQPGSCWVMIAGLLLVAATPLAGPSMLAAPSPGQLLTKNLLYGAIGTLVVLTGVFADPAGRYHRWFGHHLPRHLGFISYGIFCLHLPILHAVMWATGWDRFEGRFPWIWLLTLGVTLIAAELTYRFVEAPAMRLKDLGRRPRAASTTSPATGASTR